jgi:hypothetical protein
MEITKNTLINLISESYITDIDELAKKKVKKSDAGVRLTRPINDKDDNIQIGWEFRKDPKDRTTPLIPVLFLCGDDVDSFKQQHPEVLEELQKKYGDWYFAQESCPKFRPYANTKRIYNKASTGEPENPFDDSDIRKHKVI